MVKTYGPFASGAGASFSETQWQQLWNSLLPTGVVLGSATTPMAVFADSSGMQVKVPAGAVVLQGFLFNDDAQETLVISTANGSNPRIDRVVVRRDLSGKTIDYAVKAGTPGSSPSPPALTRDSVTWELSLAQVLVPTSASTITAGNVSDERFNPNVGGIVHPWVNAVVCVHATRPSGAGIQPGMRIFEWDTGAVFELGTDGATWNQVWEGNMAGGALASPTLTGTVAGGATYNTPRLTNPTIDGLTFVIPTTYERRSSNTDIGRADTQIGKVRWIKAWGADIVISATASVGFLGPGTSSSTWTIKNGDAQTFVAMSDNYWDAC